MFADIEKPKRGQSRRGCSCGCLIFTLSIVLALGGAALAVFLIFAPANNGGDFFGGLMNSVNQALGINAELGIEMAPAPGDASAFDPIASLPEVAAFAGEDLLFLEMTARYVRSDGTLELTASYTPSPTVEYRFMREVPRPANAPPPGVAGSTSGPWYEPITVTLEKPGVLRRITRTGGGVNISTQMVTEGMTRNVGDPTSNVSGEFIALPTCPLAQLWGTAIERGADREAVAVIEYDANGYEFRITGTSFSLDFDAECRVQ